MVASPFEVALDRGRTSLGVRLDRWRAKRWAIAQCAIAAGVAWWFAREVVGHPRRSSRRWRPWCPSVRRTGSDCGASPR